MTIKSMKLAGALLMALTVAAPLAISATPAAASPYHHVDMYHDHGHRPPMRTEHRPPMPHGHYHWRDGGWNWHGGQWAWSPGVWIRL